MFVLPPQSALSWLHASSRVEVALLEVTPSNKPGIDGTGMRGTALLDLDGTELKGWLRCIAVFHAGGVISKPLFASSLTGTKVRS